jgi:hypothetical protein
MDVNIISNNISEDSVTGAVDGKVVVTLFGQHYIQQQKI